MRLTDFVSRMPLRALESEGPWGHCSQGQEMPVGRLPASVLYPPLSFPRICPRHARANERNSIQALHAVGMLSLRVSPQVPPACPYRCCPSTPSAPTREPLSLQCPRAAPGLPSKTSPHCICICPPRHPCPLAPSGLPLRTDALLCPSHHHPQPRSFTFQLFSFRALASVTIPAPAPY